MTLDEECARMNADINRLTAEREAFESDVDTLTLHNIELQLECDNLRTALGTVTGALVIPYNGGAVYALTPNEYARCVEALNNIYEPKMK